MKEKEGKAAERNKSFHFSTKFQMYLGYSLKVKERTNEKLFPFYILALNRRNEGRKGKIMYFFFEFAVEFFFMRLEIQVSFSIKIYESKISIVEVFEFCKLFPTIIYFSFKKKYHIL